MPIGLGGIWIAAFLRQIHDHALIPLHDPRLAGDFKGKEALERG
jgi:hypothetical protein